MFVKKKINSWLIFFMSLIFLASGNVMSEEATVGQVKGRVTAVAKTIKTITVEHAGKKQNFKYDEKTVFKNISAEAIRDIQGQEVVVEYKTVGVDNIATLIKLALVELPTGVTEIKTAELVELLKKTEPGNYLLIDARPAGRYNASHIPTAVNIPLTTLEKEGEKVLPTNKNKLLIFYCGGVT